MSEERTALLMKYLTVIAIVAIFSWFVTQADPTGPQLVGWSTLQTTMSNPLGSLTSSFDLHQNTCSGWDIGCWLSNVAGVLRGTVEGLVGIIIWLITTLISVGGGLFGVLTLTFAPALPLPIQVFLWAFSAGFWVLLLMTIIGALRGN